MRGGDPDGRSQQLGQGSLLGLVWLTRVQSRSGLGGEGAYCKARDGSEQTPHLGNPSEWLIQSCPAGGRPVQEQWAQGTAWDMGGWGWSGSRLVPDCHCIQRGWGCCQAGAQQQTPLLCTCDMCARSRTAQQRTHHAPVPGATSQQQPACARGAHRSPGRVAGVQRETAEVRTDQ